MLMKYGVRTWTEFVWHRQGSSLFCFEHRGEILCSVKDRISWRAECLCAAQEGLLSMGVTCSSSVGVPWIIWIFALNLVYRSPWVCIFLKCGWDVCMC